MDDSDTLLLLTSAGLYYSLDSGSSFTQSNITSGALSLISNSINSKYAIASNSSVYCNSVINDYTNWTQSTIGKESFITKLYSLHSNLIFGSNSEENLIYDNYSHPLIYFIIKIFF